jgi:hypothetical protein
MLFICRLREVNEFSEPSSLAITPKQIAAASVMANSAVHMFASPLGAHSMRKFPNSLDASPF